MTHESLARELAEAVNQKDEGWVRRQQYAAIVDFDAALMLSILTKHLAAKEPSVGVEEVASNILLCHQCKCTWNWTVTKSSRCPACRFIEPYPNDGLGE